MSHFKLFHCAILVVFVLTTLCSSIDAKKTKDKPEWAKKDIRDYSDADLERLYDQWEEDDEPLEEDELPEHLRPSPKINLENLDPSNPESILQMSKKGKTLMAFVTINGKPTRKETEDLTGIWQMSLLNTHISVQRFVIDDNRAIFMFKDGALAWEGKDYLVTQDRVKEVTIENKVYPGKGAEPSATVKNKDEL